MNKAITDGVLLMPPVFADGLDVYSSGDGTPGSDTYENATNAAFVPADQDFGGCLEILKTQSTQRLRYMGETPLLPGCYLRVSARIKAVSGNLPSAQIAAFAGGAGSIAVPGVLTQGPSTTLTSYGDVIEVSAIVGTGLRGGVDLVWGPDALYGHFGVDLTGQTGSVVRIDDIQIEDVTSVFLRDMLALVDVRDFGAVGDGVTDDSAAFEAANTAAAGRTVLVPQGAYFLNNDVTFDAPTRFEGTVTMPTDRILLLRHNFDLPSYLDAFDDEELAFKKGFQALLNNVDHESFDMGGRKVSVTEPMDMQAAVPNKTSYATRRIIRNGQLEVQGTSAWETDVVVSSATYSTSDNRTLSAVVDVANIAVGSQVEGVGVGREIYVRSKNIATQEITLNAPLYDAVGTQDFTFSRYKYVMDFSGFDKLSKFSISDIEFQCNNVASAVNLAPSGKTFHAKDCFFTRPKDRGITSIGTGCQGMLIDRCQFLSSEDALDVSQRVSIALNANANDLKLRNCRATRFKHFAVIGGANNIISGNHFFQGDSVSNGVRSAGLVIMQTHASSVISENYIDNCFIEWSNEQDSAPEFNTEFSFSALTINDNIFLSGAVAAWTSYIVVKPHGEGHFLSGVSITGNHFRSIEGEIDRVDRVDDSIAGLNYGRFKNVTMAQNSFHNVLQQVSSPLKVKHSEASNAATWVVDTGGLLPFGARARSVDAVVLTGQILNAANTAKFQMPVVDVEQGSDKDQINLIWEEPVRGDALVTIRMDS
ncbi:MAG: glycosyl hydrolase family 28-related protein [Sulfitobacter sp.]